MASHLLRAAAHVEAGAHAEALESLIDAWREQRAPAIAEAVDALDALLGLAPFTAAPRTWCTAAKQATDAASRGPLIRAIASMNMGQILESLADALKWDDPRVGTVVITMLRELRFSGARSHTFWRDVCATIPHQRDPRFTDLLSELPQTWNVGEMQKYLTNRLTQATRTIEPHRLTPKDEAVVASILGATKTRGAKAGGSPTARRAGTSKTGEQLLADIYANPDDDDARLVYADWLLERNDPRGELIAIQLRPASGRDKASMKRERELLKAHKKEWLGRIGPIVGGELAFRRGFLAVATAKFKNQKDVEQYGSLPEWATLEELDCGSHEVRDDQWDWGRWVGPPMRRLRVLRRPMGKHLLAGNVTWTIEDLELLSHQVEVEEYRAILASPRLPELRRMRLLGSSEPSWLDGVTRCPPELLFSSGLGADDRAEWIRAAERTEARVLLFDDYGGKEHAFSRDSSNKLTRLDTVIVPPVKVRSMNPVPAALADVIKALEGMRRGTLTHFNATIEINGEMVPATPANEVAAKIISA